MTTTTPRSDTQPLQSAEQTATASPTKARPVGDMFRMTVRTASPTAATWPEHGGQPSAADVIRAVWNGDIRADQYELRIVRSEDADDLNGS